MFASRPLFTLSLELHPIQHVGATHWCYRTARRLRRPDAAHVGALSPDDFRGLGRCDLPAVTHRGSRVSARGSPRSQIHSRSGSRPCAAQ